MATQEMVRRAASRDRITYSELADLIGEQVGLRYRPDDSRLAAMLCDVSRATDRDRGVLLSAVVVHASDHLPGEGFFEFARGQGRSFEDDTAFHASALNAVFDSYS